MRTTKVIERRETIDDFTLFNTHDIDQAILDRFNAQWSGKCFASCFIHKAIQILERSSLVVDRRSLNASINVSVKFLVDCTIYNLGDLIIGTVLTIDQRGRIILVGQNIVCNLAENDALQSIKKGDKIPAYIVEMSYTISATEMTAKAVPFLPLTTNNAYYVEPEESLNLDEQISAMIAAEKRYADAMKTHAASMKHFAALMPPHKKISKPNAAKDLKKASPGTKNVISRPSTMWGLPYYVELAPNPDINKLSAGLAFEKFVGDYIRELHSVVYLAENYTADEIAAHKHVWAIYKKFKN